MKVLVIGPLPPPISGNALPVKILCEGLQEKNHDVEVINLSKSTHGSGDISTFRMMTILNVLKTIWKKHKYYDIIYLTIAESFVGNLRDIIIYFICRSRLSSIIIHMFGGTGMKGILSNQKNFQYWLNKFFIPQLGGIIVEGETQHNMFSVFTDPQKVHIVNNFAEEYLFITEKEIEENFNNNNPLRILFLSNMLYGKGHIELLNAYLKLDSELKDKIFVDFAGKLVYDNKEENFFAKLQQEKNIKYHGSVSGLDKKTLYSKAHIFCLPTYYPYEGQPFSIIEAYATGCIVITTNHSGIKDIFIDGINGYEVKKQSAESLALVIQKVFTNREILYSMAVSNLKLAKEKYTQDKYLEKTISVLENFN